MTRKITIMVLLGCLCSCTSDQTETIQSSPTIVTPVSVIKKEWSYFGEEGVQFVTPNWNIRTTIPVPRIVDSLPDFYDDLLHHYTTVFGELPYPQKAIDVFIFANETQWKRKLHEILGNGAEEWYSLGRGGLTVDGIGVLYHLDKRGRSRVTLRIAAHEGWHQYAEAVLIDPLPTWLDEGIGTWMEGFRIRSGETIFMPASNWDRLSTLRKIVSADRLDSLDFLINADPSALLSTGRTNLLGYYAQLWAFTSFILEFDEGKYRPALRRLLKAALAGNLRMPNGGWLFAFTNSPLVIEEEFRNWVKQYVRPGSSWR